jgi:predicted glycoside hydrolase/deacetylase ChbG (UPF0249 family)
MSGDVTHCRGPDAPMVTGRAARDGPTGQFRLDFAGTRGLRRTRTDGEIQRAARSANILVDDSLAHPARARARLPSRKNGATVTRDRSVPSRLIVHADDFGESAETTRGVLQAIEAGVVTSTSIMTNMPGTEEALVEAAARGRSVSFGVHLNLCEGYPLTSARTLRTLALRACLGRLEPAELEAELSAQIERASVAGVAISHLDSHKHMHQLPAVRDVIPRVARQYRIDRVRCTVNGTLLAPPLHPGRAMVRVVRSQLARQARRRFRAWGLRGPGRVIDLGDLMRLSGAAAQIVALRRPDTVTEMFCHPGTEKAEGEGVGGIGRSAELRFLLSTEFKALLREADAELVSYWVC